METRQCKLCNEVKEIADFKKVGKVVLRACRKCRNKKQYDRLASKPWPRRCSRCCRTLTKEQFGNVTQKRCRDCNRDERWARKFGISRGDYFTLLASQGGRCAICRTGKSGSSQAYTLSVDHCHRTGKVRGLLCFRCNMGIGYLKDNQETLQAAIEYLKYATSP